MIKTRYQFLMVLVGMPSLFMPMMFTVLYLTPIHGFEVACYWAMAFLIGTLVSVGTFMYMSGRADALWYGQGTDDARLAARNRQLAAHGQHLKLAHQFNKPGVTL